MTFRPHPNRYIIIHTNIALPRRRAACPAKVFIIFCRDISELSASPQFYRSTASPSRHRSTGHKLSLPAKFVIERQVRPPRLHVQRIVSNWLLARFGSTPPVEAKVRERARVRKRSACILNIYSTTIAHHDDGDSETRKHQPRKCASHQRAALR